MPKQVVCPDSGKRMSAARTTVAVCCPACGEYVRLTERGRLVRHKPAATDNSRLRQTAEAIRNWKADREG